MAELLENYPGARRALFSAFHIGGCQSCAYQPDETLAQVCHHHQIDPAEALKCLAQSRAHDQEMLLSATELHAMIQNGAPFVLLDTRTREEFEAITLPGAKLMTQEVQNALFAQSPESPTKIVLFDHRGQSVLDHCAWFRGHGLKETFGLDGGIDQYARDADSSIPRYRLEID
jgi:rhodanese-related sulfurtransferase